MRRPKQLIGAARTARVPLDRSGGAPGGHLANLGASLGALFAILSSVCFLTPFWLASGSHFGYILAPFGLHFGMILASFFEVFFGMRFWCLPEAILAAPGHPPESKTIVFL